MMKRTILLLLFAVVTAAGQDSQTGTITADGASCGPHNCVFARLEPTRTTVVSVQVAGSFTGTLKPEKTVDGSTFVAAGADVTAPGVYTFVAQGASQLRVRADALSSGTPTVTVVPSRAAVGNVTTGSGAPAGACAAEDLYVDATANTLYSCASGAWALVSGGAAGIPNVTSGVQGDTIVVQEGSPNTYVLSSNRVATDARTTTTEVITCADLYQNQGKVYKFTNAGAIAVSIDEAIASGVGNCNVGVYFDIQQGGAGAVTLTPTTSTINGGASIATASQWDAYRCRAASSGWECGKLAYASSGGGLGDPGANGLVVRTALNTATNRTLTAGEGSTVTNGDGVSGNPTIDADVESAAGAGSETTSNAVYVSLGSIVIAANRLTTGDIVECSCRARRTGSTDAPRIRILFGGTTVAGDVAWATSDLTGAAFAKVGVTGASQQRNIGWHVRANGTVAYLFNDPAEAVSGAITVDFQGRSGGTDTITIDWFRCIVLRNNSAIP